MTRFDQLLRQGLMDANLAQYEKVLLQADSVEPDFSPRYLQERMRLLADPWGWMRQRSTPRRKTRPNWRLIAAVAALLILSACAYAVATGQFTQWFPRLGMDPQAPEVSENVLARTGTVIGQSQTVGGATVTLNAAVWGGEYVNLSLAVESPDIPEELTKDSWLYTEECWFSLPEEQWQEYVRKSQEADIERLGRPADGLEGRIQSELDRGQAEYWRHLLGFSLLERGENTLVLAGTIRMKAFLENPEVTLHMENLAIYEKGKGESVSWLDGVREGPGPDVPILSGPFEFTFTLEGPILPIHYGGDVSVTFDGIPFRFTQFDVSVLDLEVSYEILAPVEPARVGEPEDTPEPELAPDTLSQEDATRAVHAVIQGLWTKDGKYVDCSEGATGTHLSANQDGLGAHGSIGRNYPYAVDPASVAAVNLGGTRVELAGMELLEDTD